MSGTQLPAGLDLRLLRVELAVSGELNSFDQNFMLKITGCKYANPTQNECVVEIANLNPSTRNYLLTELSPFNKNRTAKTATLYAGRVSSGEFMVYKGDIAVVSITQPPDLILRFKCGTLHFLKGKIGGAKGGKATSLDIIAKSAASNLGLSLRNEAKPKTIANYNNNGNALDDVVNLHNSGSDCYVDDDTLVLKEANLPLSGSLVVLDANSGMVGVPNITEKGLVVTFLVTSEVKLGGALQITSKVNPAANGTWVIYKLGFMLASREKEFYYKAYCLKAKTS